MTKPRIFITRKIPEAITQPLSDVAEVSMFEETDTAIPRERLLKEAREADGLLTMLTEQVDEELLTQTQNLKIVANMAVGYDNIDAGACQERNIVVCNTPDVLTDTTADLTFALMMSVARRMMEASEFMKKGEWKEWSPYLLAGHDVHHKTIGIVGMGRIGTAVAKRAKGFDMKILYHNRSRNEKVEHELGAKYVGFEELLNAADFVVCLTPSTTETHNLFNEQAFMLMKQNGIFINVGRGTVVDEEALYHAVVANEIAGAGLDVFQKEPLPHDHPLLKLDKVVALPHIGSSSIETRNAMAELCVRNLYEVLIDGNDAITPVKEVQG